MRDGLFLLVWAFLGLSVATAGSGTAFGGQPGQNVSGVMTAAGEVVGLRGATVGPDQRRYDCSGIDTMTAAVEVVGLRGATVGPDQRRYDRAGIDTMTAAQPQSLYAIISDIQRLSGYRFLFREGQIAGITAEFEYTRRWEEDLRALLELHGLRLRVDHDRRQSVVYVGGAAGYGQGAMQAQVLRGVVLDGERGERLGYAGVRIETEGGVVRELHSGPDGRFAAELSVRAGEMVWVSVSFVGYGTERVALRGGDVAALGGELSVRMQPRTVMADGIVITGHALGSPSDTLRSTLLSAGRFSPLGEGNAIRAVQQLPSVSTGGSLSDGLFVRGANEDAFQVLLDGAVVYNRSHLFGLLDAFNHDVIRTGALFYTVIPARYQGTPGGLLHLVTKTGSLHEYSGSAAVTGTSIRASLDGPLQRGKSSWMLAGRTSLVNTSPLATTNNLISWGLDVNRPASTDQLGGQPVVQGLDANARFYDLHGKLFFEPDSRTQWTITGYSGFDDTRQELSRLTRGEFSTVPDPSAEGLFLVRLFQEQQFETENNWGSNTLATHLSHRTAGGTQLQLTAGYSYYLTHFSREDFTYQRPSASDDQPVTFVTPFSNASELNHGHLSLEVQPDGFTQLRFGASIHRHRTAYLEESLNRPNFYLLSDSWLNEAFIENRWQLGLGLQADAGFRLHYFSNGGYLRASPRVKLLWEAAPGLQARVSYSTTHQFMHKVRFFNATTSDMWIQADADQRPTLAHTWSSGFSLATWSGGMISVEAYYRRQQNLRLHEINIQQIERPLAGSPWYTDNEGLARGVEVTLVHNHRYVVLMQGYTFSEVRLRNDIIDGGDWFFAGFDRRHQSTSTLMLRPLEGLDLSVSYYLASGIPDRLHFSSLAGAQQRMGGYRRVDVSLQYRIETGRSGNRSSFGVQSVEIQLGLYNALNRKNPWYSEIRQVVTNEGPWSRLSSERATVYDMGFQPSASLRIVF